jgi:hypothetical protein
MRKHGSPIEIYLLLFLLALVFACKGQQATQSDKGLNGTSTLVKNYFITQYPQEFFFVQGGLQDGKGNMWFATGGNGIYVYDGRSFTNFTHLDACATMIFCVAKKIGRATSGLVHGTGLYDTSHQVPGL